MCCPCNPIDSGASYPVHPIDVVFATTDSNGNIYCFSGFGVVPPAISTTVNGAEISILGDSFLRNVYSLFAYGPLVNGTPPAYVQLLSVRFAESSSRKALKLTLFLSIADNKY